MVDDLSFGMALRIFGLFITNVKFENILSFVFERNML